MTVVGDIARVRTAPPPAILAVGDLAPALARACAAYIRFAARPDNALDAPDRAAGMCGVSTLDFIAFLDEYAPSLPRARVLLYDFRDGGASRALYPLAVDNRAIDHAVALVGEVCVDWSARQFDPSAPVPLLFSLPGIP